MHTSDVYKQLDHLINIGNIGVKSKIGGDFNSFVPSADYLAFKAASLSFIKSLYGEKHPYYTMFHGSISNSNVGTVQGGINILKQIRIEVENGWLSTIRQLVTADVFSDFMAMAEHLLSEGYFHAVAVMIGSVLENT